MNFHDSPFRREFNTGFCQMELVALKKKKGKKNKNVSRRIVSILPDEAVRNRGGEVNSLADNARAVSTNAAIALVN